MLEGGTFLIEKMPDPSAVWVRGEDQHTAWGGGTPLTVDRIWPYWYNDFIKQRCVDRSLAKTGRHRSQVFADHQTLIAPAFERQNTRQIVKWVSHIGASGRWQGFGYPVQMLQSNHVIDA